MKRPLLISAAVGLVVAVLAFLIAPDPLRLGSAAGGDAGLVDRVRAVVGTDTDGYRALSVAFIDRGQVSAALVGDAPGGSQFEIGSTTKTMTGMLFADMVAEGTVRADETLASALPAVRFADPDTASITLEELASHRSGLPRLAPGYLSMAKSQFAVVRGANPYAGEDVKAVLASAAEVSPGNGRGHVNYSNFGMALLGQALAAKAGKPYDQLVTERLLRPLGMSDTYLVAPGPLSDLPPEPASALPSTPASGPTSESASRTSPSGPADGSTATGHRTEAWSGEGYAPAGIGPRSTAADMAKLVAGALAGTAPGADATRPRFAEDGDGRIGYAWFTDRYGDREITWHNGGTGGFRSYIAFDRSTQQGVVVLSNTDRSVEWIGLKLLGAEPPNGTASASPGLVRISVTIVLLVWAAGSLLLLAFTPTGRDKTWWRSKPDRLRFVTTALSTIAVLSLGYLIGAWLQVPPVLWALATGLSAAGAAGLVLRWRELPTIADGRPRARWALGVGSAAVSILVIVALAG